MNNDNCIIDKLPLILYSDVAIQRFHRAACTVPVQFKGLGVPNKYFATQNKQMYIRLHCLQVLWSLSTCFPNLKIILQIRPSVFQVQLEADGYFSAQKFLRLQPQQAGRVGTNSQFFESDFTKPTSKTLVGLHPNPIFSTKLRRLCVLTDTE